MSTTHQGTDAEALTEPSNPEPETTLETDDIFHLLQNHRRRNALRYLKAADEEQVRMRDVAEQVAAWENDTTVESLTSDERQRVYIALYQSHLPKLDEEGIITYNQSRGIIERTPLADRLDPYLDHEDGATDDAGDAIEPDTDADADEAPALRAPAFYHGAVMGLSALLLGGVALGLAPVEIAGLLVAGVLAFAAFTRLTVGWFVDTQPTN